MESFQLGFPDNIDKIENNPIDGIIGKINELNEPLVDKSSNIDMTEITNLQIPNITFQCDAVKGIIEQTPLSNFFFSEENIKYLNENIRYKVYNELKQVISSVESNELLVIMRSIFLENADFSTTNIKNELSRINDKVIDLCFLKINDNLKQYLYYIEDISSAGLNIMDRPEWQGKSTYSYDLSERNRV